MICPISFGIGWRNSMEWQSNSLESLATTKLSIIPCCLCEDCYVKADHFWCNHCCDLYALIDPIIDQDKDVILDEVVKASNGNVNVEQVLFIINKMKEIEREKNDKIK